ncbi:MAG TPA: dienelactone hydrolase family protein [Gemmatimonadaceae bacterium]|nr:dienelactone hydrolase family protein [Gemmatimonadaceae bacterium]
MSEPTVASAAADTTITSHALVVPRTARYYTLGPTHGFPRELWFACHGYGQLAGRFLRQFATLDDGTRLIVAPEGLSRFYLDPIPQRRNDPSPRIGATWMTREDRDAEIADYVEYLERLSTEVRHPLRGAAPRLVVLGFSQGTATVCRWLAASEVRVDHLVLWGGTIPPELDLAQWASRLHGAAITLVAGEQDEFTTPAAVTSEAERLSAAGVAFTLQRYPGGHTIDSPALLRLAEGFAGH